MAVPLPATSAGDGIGSATFPRPSGPPAGDGWNRRRLRIGFLTSADPRDRRSWSGIYYYMARALQNHCGDVHFLGPVGTMARRAGEGLWVASWLLFRKNYLYTHSPWLAKTYARLLEAKLARTPVDVIFAPAAAPEIAFLNTAVPIVYTADATFAVLRQYYPRYTNVLAFSARQADSVDALAVRKAALLVYPSHWAAQSALQDYHGDPARTHVIPYGANIDDPPDQESALRPRSSDVCRLLFVGVRWERKGGDIAVETLTALRAMGVPAELTICGCVPPRRLRGTPGLRVIPFLNKNDPAQRERLAELYLTSHFFLLPTRGECYGIAFCEANAFGLPVVTTNTGGVSGIVEEGENGFMLPISAGGSEYASLISRIWQDQECYSRLAHSSRRAFDERLSWDAWGAAVARLLPQLNLQTQAGRG